MTVDSHNLKLKQGTNNQIKKLISVGSHEMTMPNTNRSDMKHPSFWEVMNKHSGRVGDENGKFEGLNNVWKGEPCFVIAASQALKGIDLNLLDNQHTITVNKIINIYDKREFFLWLDQSFLDKNKYDLKKYQGTILQNSLTSDVFTGKNNVVRFQRREISKFEVSEIIEDGLYNCQSGVAALNFAIIAGANPIYLIGHDSTTDDKTQSDYFSTKYRETTPAKANYDEYESRKMGWYGKFLKYADRIINVCDLDRAFTFRNYFKTIPFNEIDLSKKYRK
jgi:hypothetical protein